MDVALWELSRKFVYESDLREVALKGLGVSADCVEKHIKSKQNDITSASYNLFREWFKKLSDTKSAGHTMKEALKKAEKPFLIQVPNCYSAI